MYTEGDRSVSVIGPSSHYTCHVYRGRQECECNWALKSLHVTYTEGDRSVSVIGPSSHYTCHVYTTYNSGLCGAMLWSRCGISIVVDIISNTTQRIDRNAVKRRGWVGGQYREYCGMCQHEQGRGVRERLKERWVEERNWLGRRVDGRKREENGGEQSRMQNLPLSTTELVT